MKKIKLYLIAAAAALTSAVSYAQNDDFEIIFTDDGSQQEMINVPEALYLSEVDSLLQLYHTQLYLVEDDGCVSSSSSPDYTSQQIEERLRRMPTTIDMAYNPIVKQFIDRYVTRMRKSVSLMLGSSNFYMPIFEQALESYNVPIELKYLPVIESALNPKAVSRVGATGLWQFMLATGKQYGLRVNSLVDDRRDPIRSSYAAARLLRDLYRIFGDWTLAIAAYNCGPQNVNKAIRRSGGSRDYWTIYPYLPSETRGYVPAFIAANYVMTYYCEHNICPMLTNLPERTDTVVVNKNVSFSTLTKFCDIDINLLRELNPQYRRDLVNGLTEPSTIRMPVSAINKFVEQEDSIMAYDASRHGRSSYVAVEDKSSKSSGKSSSTQRSSHSANSYATNRYGRNGRAASSSAANSAQTATSRYGRSSKYNSQSSTGYRSKRGRRG